MPGPGPAGQCRGDWKGLKLLPGDGQSPAASSWGHTQGVSCLGEAKIHGKIRITEETLGWATFPSLPAILLELKAGCASTSSASTTVDTSLLPKGEKFPCISLYLCPPSQEGCVLGVQGLLPEPLWCPSPGRDHCQSSSGSCPRDVGALCWHIWVSGHSPGQLQPSVSPSLEFPQLIPIFPLNFVLSQAGTTLCPHLLSPHCILCENQHLCEQFHMLMNLSSLSLFTFSLSRKKSRNRQ